MQILCIYVRCKCEATSVYYLQCKQHSFHVCMQKNQIMNKDENNNQLIFVTNIGTKQIKLILSAQVYFDSYLIMAQLNLQSNRLSPYAPPGDTVDTVDTVDQIKYQQVIISNLLKSYKCVYVTIRHARKAKACIVNYIVKWTPL